MPGTTRPSSPWLTCIEARPDAGVRLVCLPYAGGGPSAFWPWSKDLGPLVEVWCVQLPGRERRFAEPPPTSMADAVPSIVDAIADHVEPPFALFGHSMGGLLALETARALQRSGQTPARLFVSGARAPELVATDGAHTLDDLALERWLVTLGGLPQEVRADRQLLAMILPTVRADLELCDGYEHRPSPPLACPITAFSGADDPLAPATDMWGWAAQTTGGFGLTVIPGDHFFLNQHRRSVTGVIALAIGDLLERAAGRRERPAPTRRHARESRQR